MASTPHVRPLLPRVMYASHPHALGYTELCATAYLNVSKVLRRRLQSHELDIFFGRATDMRDAVRQAAERDRQRKLEDRATVARHWAVRQVGKAAKQYRVNREWLLSDSPACAYCGGLATTADHAVPRCQGGTHNRRNLVPACHRCNSAKSGMTLDEWRCTRAARGKPWPPRWDGTAGPRRAT